MKKTRVLIVGGGFGGLYAALEFERRRYADIEVTLISEENFFLFTPMLHEVAASDLDLTHIVNPIRKMLRYVRFFEGEGSFGRPRASMCRRRSRVRPAFSFARIRPHRVRTRLRHEFLQYPRSPRKGRYHEVARRRDCAAQPLD